MDFWAVSDTYRYGIFVPDEDPPGNQVTTRVEKVLLLSHSLQRSAHVLIPRSTPVSLSLLGYSAMPLLLHSSNKACSGFVGVCAIYKHFSGFGFFLLPNRIHACTELVLSMSKCPPQRQ